MIFLSPGGVWTRSLEGISTRSLHILAFEGTRLLFRDGLWDADASGGGKFKRDSFFCTSFIQRLVLFIMLSDVFSCMKHIQKRLVKIRTGMDLKKSQIFYRFLFQKLILQTSHLFLGAGRLGLVSGFRPKFYAKTRSRQRHPNKKEELFLFLEICILTIVCSMVNTPKN